MCFRVFLFIIIPYGKHRRSLLLRIIICQLIESLRCGRFQLVNYVYYLIIQSLIFIVVLSVCDDNALKSWILLRNQMFDLQMIMAVIKYSKILLVLFDRLAPRVRDWQLVIKMYHHVLRDFFVLVQMIFNLQYNINLFLFLFLTGCIIHTILLLVNLWLN